MSINQFMPQPSTVNLPYTPDPFLSNVLIGADMQIMINQAGWNDGYANPTGFVNTGAVALSNNRAKFGETSLFYPSRGKAIYYPSTGNPDFNCGTVNWSQELWVYRNPTPTSNGHFLVSHAAVTSNSEPSLAMSGNGYVEIRSANTTIYTSPDAAPLGEWVHIAWGGICYR